MILEDFSFIDQVGKVLLFYAPSCASTQDLVFLCARQTGEKHPVALITFNQTHGRGQHQRAWISEPGKNLAMSVVLPLSHPAVDRLPLLNMAITLACVRALQTLGISTNIKWPNDLRYQGAKLAGLLMEAHAAGPGKKSLCVGLGVNVNQKIFDISEQEVTSLSNISHTEHNLMDLCHAILKQLQVAWKQWEKATDDQQILAQYQASLEGLNDTWELTTDSPNPPLAMLKGVDANGRVLLEIEGQTRAFHHGEIRLKKI